MKKLLKELVYIQIGYQARGKISQDPGGLYRIIQSKDFDEKVALKKESIYQFTPERNPKKYRVQKGDVLFLSKGHKNSAFAISEPLENTIATSNYFILKITSDKLIPEYLAWYINQPPAQSFIKSHSRGTYIPIIPKVVFEYLEIFIPQLDIQQKIIHVHYLSRRELDLLKQITETRIQLVHHW